MRGRDEDTKRVFLMGQMRVEGKFLDSLNRDPEALQLLALLILAKTSEQDLGALKDGEVRREWLLQTLLPSFGEVEQARERIVYLLNKKLEPALGIRANDGKREPEVARLTFDHLWIDVQEIKTAAAQMHNPQHQETIIALAAQPLLSEMSYPWLDTEPFQVVRATVEDWVLQALARRADNLVAQRETATAQGQASKAETCRADAIALLDKAAARLGNQDTHPKLFAWFRELRTRAAYGSPILGTVPRHNLRRPINRFIGRADEQAALKSRLAEGRLVTLTGIGGTGKTRLALETAYTLLGDAWDAIWVVELAALTEPARVPQTVASTLGLEVRADATETVIAALQSQRTLLLFDNCEHLVDSSAALIETLLQACPHLKVIATSREPLRLDGEHLCPLPPLPFPSDLPPDMSDPAAFLLGFDSVRLFLDRAGLQQQLTLTAENAASIAAICAGLDGIPLALELAAARVKLLPLERIAEMLSDRFGLLTDGRRTALPRHKTLRAVIDWSYDLLTEPEQALLCRLSVFAGGWTWDAAEAVCLSEAQGQSDVLPLLTSLVDKSLILTDLSATPARYRILETVRHYAQDRLRERGGWDETRRKHREFYLRLAEEAEPLLRGPEQKQWLDRLETEHDNFRSALALQTDETALRIACALQRFWVIRGYFAESQNWFSQSLDNLAQVSEKMQAKAFIAIGRLAYVQGKLAEAETRYEQGLTLHQKSSNQQGIADALFSLGCVAESWGHYTQAIEKHEQSLAIYYGLEDERGIAEVLYGLGMATQNQDNYELSRKHLEASLILRRKLGDTMGIANVLTGLGNTVFYQGQFAEAEAYYQESLTLRQILGEKKGIAGSYADLASIAQAQGDYPKARALLHQSFCLQESIGNQYGMMISRSVLADVAYNDGKYNEATHHYKQILSYFEAQKDELSIGILTSSLGSIARQQGKYSEARTLLQNALVIFQARAEKSCIINSLGELGHLAALEQEYELATRLWSAEKSLANLIGHQRPPNEEARNQAAISKAREALGDLVFTSAWEQGRAMTREEAVAFALGEAEA